MTMVETVGWVFQVTAVSVQLPVSKRASSTLPLETLVRQRVRVAELTVEPAGIEETSKATRTRFTLVAPDFTAMSAAIPKLSVALSSFT